MNHEPKKILSGLEFYVWEAVTKKGLKIVLCRGDSIATKKIKDMLTEANDMALKYGKSFREIQSKKPKELTTSMLPRSHSNLPKNQTYPWVKKQTATIVEVEKEIGCKFQWYSSLRFHIQSGDETSKSTLMIQNTSVEVTLSTTQLLNVLPKIQVPTTHGIPLGIGDFDTHTLMIAADWLGWE